MNYTIQHTASYQYSQPVFLEPHTMRFRPRTDSRQCVTAWRLDIEPAPVARTELIEAEGTLATRAWFAGTTAQLTVHSACDVEILDSNPFDFIPEQPTIPLQGESVADDLLTPARRRQFEDPQVDCIVEEILAKSRREPIGFLTELCRSLHEDITYAHRADGDPYTPSETLKHGSGACRDLAVLFIDCCRAAGLAARFVSGYTAKPDDDGLRNLHAWAEVYIPGGGWRAFDPSWGLAVGEDHIAVAASAEPEQTATVSGTFRGAATALATHTIRFAGDADR